MTLEAFFLLAFLSLSLSLSLSFSRVTCAFPFNYKRGSRTPTNGSRLKGTEFNQTQLHSILPSETWDLLPLSPVCNPYYKQVPVTRAASNWTQRRSARTSINPCVLRAHHPGQMRKHKFTSQRFETPTKIVIVAIVKCWALFVSLKFDLC